ncbi:MAG: hypothetical protein JSU67_02550 [Gammaproteobacteria bacterium]|nr:MAG: hypothetical protein JSU67_02550 [Gammaproteobacteria bacterium]
MEYIDTDTTHTDWDELGQQNKTERCPVTGVSTALKYGPAEHSSDEPVGSDTERRKQSNPELQAMFDKFLYQK